MAILFTPVGLSLRLSHGFGMKKAAAGASPKVAKCLVASVATRTNGVNACTDAATDGVPHLRAGWRRRSHGSVGLGILLAVPLVLANLVHPSLGALSLVVIAVARGAWLAHPFRVRGVVAAALLPAHQALGWSNLLRSCAQTFFANSGGGALRTRRWAWSTMCTCSSLGLHRSRPLSPWCSWWLGDDWPFGLHRRHLGSASACD